MASALLAVLTAWCRAHGLPDPEDEYPFHPTRKWRFDFAWPELMLAVEVDGGLHVGGRHIRGRGRENDLAKVAEGQCLGWRVLTVSTDMVNDGRLLAWLERLTEVERGG
jgi:very-short-patch-repair endonuclease